MNSDIKNDNTRDRLGFAKAVAEYIKPLLSTHGFACIESTSFAVRFQSSVVEAVVSHDRLSYEIEAAFICRMEPKRRCTLADVLDAAHGLGHKQQTFFQASKSEDVVWCVKAIAALIEKHAQAVLDGEQAAYQRIEELARSRNAAYTKQVVQQPIRRKAEQAWESHNYTEARELYTSIEPELTSLEKKRLKYARENSNKA